MGFNQNQIKFTLRKIKKFKNVTAVGLGLTFSVIVPSYLENYTVSANQVSNIFVFFGGSESASFSKSGLNASIKDYSRSGYSLTTFNYWLESKAISEPSTSTFVYIISKEDERLGKETLRNELNKFINLSNRKVILVVNSNTPIAKELSKEFSNKAKVVDWSNLNSSQKISSLTSSTEFKEDIAKRELNNTISKLTNLKNSLLAHKNNNVSHFRSQLDNLYPEYNGSIERLQNSSRTNSLVKLDEKVYSLKVEISSILLERELLHRALSNVKLSTQQKKDVVYSATLRKNIYKIDEELKRIPNGDKRAETLLRTADRYFKTLNTYFKNYRNDSNESTARNILRDYIESQGFEKHGYYIDSDSYLMNREHDSILVNSLNNIDKSKFALSRYWYAFGAKDLSEISKNRHIINEKTHIQHIEQFVRYSLVQKDILAKYSSLLDSTSNGKTYSEVFEDFPLNKAWSSHGSYKEAVIITQPNEVLSVNEAKKIAQAAVTLAKNNKNVIYIESSLSSPHKNTIRELFAKEIKSNPNLQKNLAVFINTEYSDYKIAVNILNTIFTKENLVNIGELRNRTIKTFDEEITNFALKFNPSSKWNNKYKSILALGDSNTQSVFHSKGGKNASEYLKELIEKKNNINIKIQNQAVSGTRSQNIIENYNKARIKTSKVKEHDVIYIAYGINDINAKLSPQDITKNIVDGIKHIRKYEPNARILVGEVTPEPRMLKYAHHRNGQTIRDLNKLINQASKENNFTVVKNYDLIQSAISKFGQKTILTDGLHYSDYGSMLVAQNIYSELTKK